MTDKSTDMDKHAYLIMAYDRKNQLETLLRLLDDERNHLYIHIDRKSSMDTAGLSDICKKSRLVFITPERIHWGGYSQMWTEIRLLQSAASLHYSRYHLLSGRDMPLHTQDEIHEFFNNHTKEEYISIWDVSDETVLRFNYYTLFPEGNRFFLTHFLNNIIKKTLKAVGLRINANILPATGANWFSITDECAQLVISQTDRIHDIFSHTSNSDEMMLQTIVKASILKDRVTGTNLRLIRWNEGERHPHTMTMADWDILDKADELFARKFDSKVDNDIIMKLYHKLNG